MAYHRPRKAKLRFTFISARLSRYGEQLLICGAHNLVADFATYSITFEVADERAFYRAFKYQKTAGSTMRREKLSGGEFELLDDPPEEE